MHTIRLIPGGDAFCLSFSSLFSCFAHDGQTTAISQQSGRFPILFPAAQIGTAAQKVKPSAFFISVRRRFTREILRCISWAISRIFFPASTSAAIHFLCSCVFPARFLYSRERRPAKYPSDPSSPKARRMRELVYR